MTTPTAHCPKCNQPVDEEYRFCPECGSEVIAGPADQEPSTLDDTGSFDGAPSAAEPAVVPEVPDLADGGTEDNVGPAFASQHGGLQAALQAEHAISAGAGSGLGGCPIVLEVMRGGSLRTGDRGLLQMRLRSRDDAPPLSVELDVSSSLKLVEPTFFEFDFDPGERTAHHQAFLVSETGQQWFAFKVTVEGGRREQFEGRIVIEVEPASANTQVFQITQTQNNEGKFNIGNEMGIRLDLGRDAAQKPEADFITIPLSRPGRIRTRQLKRILKGYEHVEPYRTSRMCLHFHTKNGTRTYCLLAGQRMSLGKQRGRDIVLRAMPPSPENDPLTGRISREHAWIEFDPAGALWRNADNCRNGTTIDDALLVAGESALLRQGSVIRAAEAVMLSCASYYNDPVSDEAAYVRFCQDLGTDPKTQADSSLSPVGNARAIRLTRHDDLAELEQYLIFQCGVSIGSGPTCPIYLPKESLSPIHAHVLHLAGSFWLEAAQTPEPTLVDANSLPLHRLLPLRPNLVFQLGEVIVTATAFQQYYLDAMPPGA